MITLLVTLIILGPLLFVAYELGRVDGELRALQHTFKRRDTGEAKK